MALMMPKPYLVENSSKDIYIITKQDSPSRIYKIPYPQDTGATNTAVLVGSLSFGGVTGQLYQQMERKYWLEHITLFFIGKELQLILWSRHCPGALLYSTHSSSRKAKRSVSKMITQVFLH